MRYRTNTERMISRIENRPLLEPAIDLCQRTAAAGQSAREPPIDEKSLRRWCLWRESNSRPSHYEAKQFPCPSWRGSQSGPSSPLLPLIRHECRGNAELIRATQLQYEDRIVVPPRGEDYRRTNVRETCGPSLRKPADRVFLWAPDNAPPARAGCW